MSAFPMLWVRLGVGAPSEPGVYLRATDVAAWLRDLGFDDLAELLDDADEWVESETLVVQAATRETERS